MLPYFLFLTSNPVKARLGYLFNYQQAIYQIFTYSVLHLCLCQMTLCTIWKKPSSVTCLLHSVILCLTSNFRTLLSSTILSPEHSHILFLLFSSGTRHLIYICCLILLMLLIHPLSFFSYRFSWRRFCLANEKVIPLSYFSHLI